MGKQDTPRFSVIMNCYNAEAFLRESIESVYSQSFPDWEIVLFDNGSTDRSGEIAKGFDSKLRYFRQEENVPLGHARALAVERARGEFLAFLDCDDLWFPNRLERSLEFMSDPAVAMSYGGTHEIDREGRFLRRCLPAHSGENMFEKLLVNFEVNTPTWTVRTSSLKKHGFSFDRTFRASEEYNLSLRLAAREKIVTIPEYLGAWRCHGGSTTGRTIAYWAEERAKTLDLVKEENPGIFEKHKDASNEAYARVHYLRARYLVESGKREEARQELQVARAQGFRYEFLYWIAFLPTSVWNFFHSTYIKRKIVPRVLGLVRT